MAAHFHSLLLDPSEASFGEVPVDLALVEDLNSVAAEDFDYLVEEAAVG